MDGEATWKPQDQESIPTKVEPGAGPQHEEKVDLRKFKKVRMKRGKM
jgi:hypothetical protein